MSSTYCKECGNQSFDKNAKKCPDCGGSLERKPNSIKEKVGMLGFVVVIIILFASMGKISDFFEKGSPLEDDSGKESAAPVVDKSFINDKTSVLERKTPEDEFLETIEIHHMELVSLNNEDKTEDASREPEPIKKYNKVEHQNVKNIEKKSEIVELEKRAKSIPASRIADNLVIYKQLLALEPSNPKYKNKVAFYTKKIEANKRKKKKRKQFVMINKTGSVPVLSFPIDGAIVGSIPAGKKVQIFEKQSFKSGMTTQTWYRVKTNGSYGWISKDVTTGGIVGENVTTAKHQ
jgi:hypothetical protein